MSFLKDLFKGKKNKKDPYENAPAFRQMMMELEKEENEFIERFEKILPVIRPNPGEEASNTSDEGDHKSQNLQPVSFPLDFDPDFCIYLGVSHDGEYEWLLNRHIEVAKDKIDPDKLVSKAFGNLFQHIEKKIAVKMITDNIGMLDNCHSLESSLVLINEIWTLARKYVHSDDLIFAIPARDVFIFTCQGDEKTLELFREKVKSYYSDPAHPDKLSDKLYLKRKNGKTEQLV